MKYIKMQGAGNDYVFFDCIENKFDLDPERLSPLVSDRHLGIGADGIILIKNTNNADCFMAYIMLMVVGQKCVEMA